MELADLSVDQLRWLCDQSFFHFIRIVGGSVDQGRDIIEEIHRPICDFEQNPLNKRTGITMPRIWRKSTCFTKWFSIWSYLQDNESRILIVSENERLAGRMLHWIEKQILTNRLLRKLYPELDVVDKSWIKSNRWSGSECDLPHKGIYSDPTISAIGVGGASQSGHFTLILLDDIVGKRQMDSAVELENTLLWLDNLEELLVEPDYTKPNGSKINLSGTHWRPGDALCYIQDKYPQYKWKKVSCLKREGKDPNIWIDNPNVGVGESNFPLFSTESYIEMMNNPEKAMIFWTQHMNDPSAASEITKFEISWLRYYRWDTMGDERVIVCKDDGEVIPFTSFPTYMFIDPGGFSETKIKGSRNAIVCGGQPAGSHKKFITWAWAGRPKEPIKFLDEVFKAYEDQKPRTIRIENIAAQDYICRDVMQERDRRGLKIPILPLEHDVNKNVKDADIVALIKPMSNGEIYVHETMKDVIAEVASYPGITNDLLNCMAWLNRYVWKRGVRQDMRYMNDKSNWIADHRSVRTGY